ncbi:hypothetical protein HDU87_003340 [Geranomyces variabilis]|uniref:Uncharacterized protein n=1 Tax=Geranomyces variabilis TaxID=109894 RepID=A0AAD5XN73_9FUNG|nr:hypothetical protein HDU87_003340 [Geranomyces variabilis]
MDSYHNRSQPPQPPPPVGISPAQTQMSSELLQYLASTQKHMADWAASAGLPVDAFADAHRGFLPTPRPSGESKSRFHEPFHGDEELRKYHEQQKILEQQYILQEKLKSQPATPAETPAYASQQQDLQEMYEAQERDKRREADSSQARDTAVNETPQPRHPESGAASFQDSPASSLTGGSAGRGQVRYRQRLPAVNPHAIRSARNSLELNPRGEESMLRISRSVPHFDAVDGIISPFARSRQDSDETIVADSTFDDPDMFSAYEFLSSSRVPCAMPYDGSSERRMQGSEISSLVDKFPQPPGENSGKSFALEQYQLMQAWTQRKKAGKGSTAAKGAAGTSLASLSEHGVNSARDALLPRSLNLPAITSEYQLTPPSSPPLFSQPQTVDEWLRYQYAGADGENGAAPMPGPFRTSKKPPKRMSFVMTDWKRGRFQGATNAFSTSTSSIASVPKPEVSIPEEAEAPVSLPAAPTEVVKELPLIKKAVLNEVLLDYTMTVNRLREPALDSQRAVLRKTRSLAALHFEDARSVEAEAMPVQSAACGLAALPPSPPPEPKAELPTVQKETPLSVVAAAYTLESKAGPVDVPLNYAVMVERMARPNMEEQRAVLRRPAPRKMATVPSLASSSHHLPQNTDIIEVHARTKKLRSAGVASGGVGKAMFRRLMLGRGASNGRKSKPVGETEHEVISVDPEVIAPIIPDADATRTDAKAPSIRRRMTSLSTRSPTASPPLPAEPLPTPPKTRPSIFDSSKSPRRAASKSSFSGAVSPTRLGATSPSALSTAFGEAITEAIGAAFANGSEQTADEEVPGNVTASFENREPNSQSDVSAAPDSLATSASAGSDAEGTTEISRPVSPNNAETHAVTRSTVREQLITSPSNSPPAVVVDPSSPSSSSSSLIARPLSALSSSSTCSRASVSLARDRSGVDFALQPGRRPTSPNIEAILAKLRG